MPLGQKIIVSPDARLTPNQAAQLAAMQNQRRRTSWPYYSKVKFAAAQAAAGAAFTYTIPQGTVIRAFSYGVGEQMLNAGFTTQDGNATIAETNLQLRNTTVANQNVIVHGIALQIEPAIFHRNGAQGETVPRFRLTDAHLLAFLWDSVSVEVGVNGDENVFKLGVPGLIPGAGGLMGAAADLTGLVGLSGTPNSIAYPDNGWPTRSNFFRLPEGFVWFSTSAQLSADTMFNVIFRVQRDIVVFSGGDPDNNALGIDIIADDVPATRGYNYPAEIAVGVMVHLIGEVDAPRTRAA